ncbi:MAG TPA: hypothetical protein VFM19_08795 [Candidatus Limnocylindria bacterium]|nr:hypothetical protein [Candidatus Limnocylindria bacterium]
MGWLERHAWWGLAFMSVVIVVFGLTDMAVGASADPAIPLSLTGMTLVQLEAESAVVFRLYDFYTRVTGFSLVLLGLLTAAIVVFAYRRHARWAWWTMWLLPAWAAGAALFYVVAGLAPGQAPPPPMISGPIVAVLGAALLLASARPFFRAAAG